MKLSHQIALLRLSVLLLPMTKVQITYIRYLYATIFLSLLAIYNIQRCLLTIFKS